MRIYVICAYGHAAQARLLHARLRTEGHEPVSSWVDGAKGPERLDLMSDSQCRATWEQNCADLARAEVVIVLADTPMREGWCEVARLAEQRVCVVGPANLTTRAHGWDHVATDADALAWVERMGGKR